MAGSDLFLKNGFRVVDTSGDDVLLSREWKRGTLPCFNDREKQRARHTGLTIVHTGQCPWVSRFVEQVRDSDLPRHFRLTIRELKTPAQAQRAPALYATFSLLYKGRVLAGRVPAQEERRPSARELGLTVDIFSRGKHNAITDVPGFWLDMPLSWQVTASAPVSLRSCLTARQWIRKGEKKSEIWRLTVQTPPQAGCNWHVWFNVSAVCTLPPGNSSGSS